MLVDDMDQWGENLRNDAVRGPSLGQTALRRLLSGRPTPDRLLTPVILGERTPKTGSVIARSDPSAHNAYFRNPTEEEFRSPLQFTDGSDGNRTLAGLEQSEKAREKEADAVSRIMGGEKMTRFKAAGFDERSYSEQVQTANLDTSTYLPGDFRYLHSTYPSIQDNGVEDSSVGKMARSPFPHSPEPDLRTQQAVWQDDVDLDRFRRETAGLFDAENKGEVVEMTHRMGRAGAEFSATHSRKASPYSLSDS
jgi:hypothetical protein